MSSSYYRIYAWIRLSCTVNDIYIVEYWLAWPWSMGNLAFKVTENGTIDRSCTPYYYSYICSIFELFDVENIVTLKSSHSRSNCIIRHIVHSSYLSSIVNMSIWFGYWDIQCRILVQLWNMGYRSFIILHNCRGIWHCIISWPWNVGHSRSSKMAPFGRSHTSSYSSFIVIMLVSCTAVSKWSEILVEKRQFSYPIPFNLHDHLDPLGIFSPKL